MNVASDSDTVADLKTREAAADPEAAVICAFYGRGGCKRGKACKFRHVDPKTGRSPTGRSSAWRNHAVANMTRNVATGSWVARAGVGQALARFFIKHKPMLTYQGCTTENGETTLELTPLAVSSVAQQMMRSHSVFVMTSSGKRLELHGQHCEVHGKTVYHCTGLWAALSSLMVGHLCAGHAAPTGVYFSQQKQPYYDEGACFEANLIGIYPSKKAFKDFEEGVVPLGVLLHNDRSAKDWICCPFSHQLMKLTVKQSLLESFLQDWILADEPQICFPLPAKPKVASYNLVLKTPTNASAIHLLQARDELEDVMRAEYQQVLLSCVGWKESEPTSSSAARKMAHSVQFLPASASSSSDTLADPVFGKRKQQLTQEECEATYGIGAKFMARMGGFEENIFNDVRRHLPDADDAYQGTGFGIHSYAESSAIKQQKGKKPDGICIDDNPRTQQKSSAGFQNDHVWKCHLCTATWKPGDAENTSWTQTKTSKRWYCGQPCKPW